MLIPRPQPRRSAETSRRWTASELQRRDGWRPTVPAAVADEVQDFLARRPQLDDAPESAEFEPAALPRLAAFATTLRAELLHGSGVVHVRGLRDHGVAGNRARAFHNLLGSALGAPLEQYGRLFEVRDRGVDHVTERVPVSMSRATTTFHTDSSSVDVQPDLVGLLCERPAHRGGDSLVSNAVQARAVLASESPASLAILRQPLIRDIVTPGGGTSEQALLRNRFPVFGGAADGPDFLFRYMRLWIERGQQRAGRPLDAAALQALDRLDEVLARPAHAVRLRLEAGEMLWVDNRCLAHDRDAYEDDPAAPRCLLRMWVACRGTAAGTDIPAAPAASQFG